jgi:transcriptional regulator with XRE-family HTH domain
MVGVDMNIDYSFADNLREARVSCSFTTHEVAHLTGMDHMQISKYECGKQQPSIMSLMMLCALYDVTPNDLLGIVIDEQ